MFSQSTAHYLLLVFSFALRDYESFLTTRSNLELLLLMMMCNWLLNVMSADPEKHYHSYYIHIILLLFQMILQLHNAWSENACSCSSRSYGICCTVYILSDLLCTHNISVCVHAQKIQKYVMFSWRPCKIRQVQSCCKPQVERENKRSGRV